MPKILSLSTRPRSLSALWGQDSTVKAIRQHVAKRPPQAWLFYGPSGTGKTTLAKILSVSYQCQHMELWGDPCEDCWKRRSDFAIHEINASEVSGIEELKRVVDLSRYKPSAAKGKRVIVLDEAQGISNAAQKMLLAPFESPPESTVWIVCTTEPAKLLPTLRRRCVAYQLKPLGISAAESFLRKKATAAKVDRPLEPLLEQCHLMGVGAPAVLLQALEKYAAGASATDAVTGTESALDSLRICKAVTSGDWKTVAANLNEASPDEARYVRASVAGWLKGCLARETSPAGQERAALSLLDLASEPFEEAMKMPWLWAALWKICRRYGK